MKKLIIVAHPNYDYSKVTKGIVELIAKDAKKTDIRILDQKGVFNVQEEQKILSEYDLITFAFPLWWYAAPWTLKKYFDEVFTPGFAFSYKGVIDDFKLRNKMFSLIISVGNVSATYKEGAGNLFTVSDYLAWIKGLFHLVTSAWTATGVINGADKCIIKPVISYGGAVNGGEIEKSAEDYLKRIDPL